jgi:porin
MAMRRLNINEFSYEQNFDNKLINTKSGFSPMGEDFGHTPFVCDFQKTGFCAHPQNLGSSSGWDDYPVGTWGGRIRITPVPAFYIETGAYDVNPTHGLRENGLDMKTSGCTGAIISIEAGNTSALGAAQMPGHYKVGAYYDTSDAASVTDTDEMETGAMVSISWPTRCWSPSTAGRSAGCMASPRFPTLTPSPPRSRARCWAR